MSGLDIFFSALAVALVAHGLWKGGVRTLFGLAGLVLAYLFAGYAAAPLGGLLLFLPASIRHTIAVVAGFALIFTVVAVAGILLNKTVDAVGLSPLNRLLGAFVGLAMAFYLAGGAVRLAPRLSPSFQQKVERSWVTQTLSAGALFLEQLLPNPSAHVPLRPLTPPADAPPAK